MSIDMGSLFLNYFFFLFFSPSVRALRQTTLQPRLADVLASSTAARMSTPVSVHREVGYLPSLYKLMGRST